MRVEHRFEDTGEEKVARTESTGLRVEHRFEDTGEEKLHGQEAQA